MGGAPTDLVEMMDEYQWYNVMRVGAIFRAQLMYMRLPGLGSIDIMSEDKLGNPACKFPIAAAFGDRDHLSSENGAELAIKQNCNFESGGSQLFKVKDCTHFIPIEQVQ